MSAAARIREARQILCDLLLRDEFAQDIGLGGQVSETLNETVLKLSDLAGQQELFELWIAN